MLAGKQSGFKKEVRGLISLSDWGEEYRENPESIYFSSQHAIYSQKCIYISAEVLVQVIAMIPTNKDLPWRVSSDEHSQRFQGNWTISELIMSLFTPAAANNIIFTEFWTQMETLKKADQTE